MTFSQHVAVSNTSIWPTERRALKDVRSCDLGPCVQYYLVEMGKKRYGKKGNKATEDRDDDDHEPTSLQGRLNKQKQVRLPEISQ